MECYRLQHTGNDGSSVAATIKWLKNDHPVTVERRSYAPANQKKKKIDAINNCYGYYNTR